MLYMTQFWVSGLRSTEISAPVNTNVVVLVLQQLLGANRLRVMDVVSVQRRLHRPASFRHRCLRSIRLRPHLRPVSSTLHSGAGECVFHEDRILALGRERFIP